MFKSIWRWTKARFSGEVFVDEDEREQVARRDGEMRAIVHESWQDYNAAQADRYGAVIGISCSGGGIRSAAFSLGALQELREEKVLDRAAWLAAVSGGSYIAAAHYLVRRREFPRERGAKSRDRSIRDITDEEYNDSFTSRAGEAAYALARIIRRGPLARVGRRCGVSGRR